MSTDLPQDVRDAADTTAVTQLVLTERECRDFGRWARMRDCYHPDSMVHLSWFSGTGPDFVERSIDMARRGVLATHRLGAVGVRLNSERAVASLAATIDIPGTLAGVDVYLSSHARFLYRAERRDRRWRLAGFEAFYLRDELHPQRPGQSVAVTPDQLSGFRPSYRMLSMLLNAQGYAVNPDLPGTDRPESVQAMCREVYGWAGLEP